MKTIFIAILIYLFFCSSIMAKTNKDTISFPKNSIYGEILGAGGYYSINYDRIMFSKKQIKISLKYGASCYTYKKIFSIIHSFQMNLLQPSNQKNIWLEAGIGLTESFETKYSSLTLISSSMGLRFQNPKSHLFFKTYMFIPILCRIKSAPSSLLTPPNISYYIDYASGYFNRMSLMSISIGVTF